MSYTLENVLLGSMILGATGGVLGSFTLLRRQSLLGDALAHAALPGVCGAFLLTGSKHPLALLLGATASGLAGAFVILAIIRGSRIKEDTAIGIVLSVFFGFGIVLLTYIQHRPLASQTGLDRFLFGQAASLVEKDVRMMALLGGGALLLTALLFKELQLLSFDPEFGVAMGMPMRRLEALLTLLLVVVIVIGLQTVGVVLVIAALVTPAAAARQWTERLGTMVILSGAVGAVTGAGGALLSANVPRLPTGPTIVLLASAILVASLLFAPERGMVGAVLRHRRAQARIRRENLLKDLYHWAEAKNDWASFVPAPVLMGYRGSEGATYERTLAPLIRAGFVEVRGDAARLSEKGKREAARIVRKHRLWETYLSRRLELPEDHLHRDAEQMEHALTETDVEFLDERLGRPAEDPHGRPIPR